MHIDWREDGGSFVADMEEFHLQVRKLDDRRGVRFSISRKGQARPRHLIVSGFRENFAPAMHAAEAAAARIRLLSDGAKPLVMVVAEEDGLRDSVAGVLREDGYRVTQAKTAEGALRRLERTPWHGLVVADLDLGSGMGGIELARTVQELWPSTRVLIMSVERRRREKRWHGNHLTKPFSRRALLDKVSAALL